jgi:23S rRNA-/tRNA-specific pseudouridylate synthase
MALTSNVPANRVGVLEDWHRKEKKKAVLVSEGTSFAERAKLEFAIMPYENYFLWNIQLHTGKYHQIRVHLANLGCFILGDSLYGSTETFHLNAIALHAAKLIIQHPVTRQQITFEADCNFKL